MTARAERLARPGLGTLARRLVLLLIASYGLLYYSYKYLVPERGVGDSDYYYPVFRQPLNFHVAGSPFVLRQVSAVLTWLVWHTHLFYSTKISFANAAYDQHLFFAALVANWLSLVVTALVAGLIAEELLGARHTLVAAVAGLLCLLTFHAQAAVITNMAEGPAWLLITLAFLCLLRRSRVWLGVVLVLAVFERELVLLAFGFLVALDLLPWRSPRRFRVLSLLGAVLCFFVYLGLRREVAGYDFQTHPGHLFSMMFRIDFSNNLFFPVLLAQNVMFLALGTWVAARGRPAATRAWLPKVLACFAFLVLISLGSDEINNTGRLAGILTPLFAACAATSLAMLQTGGVADAEEPVPAHALLSGNLPAWIFVAFSVVFLAVVYCVPSLHRQPVHRIGPKHPQAVPRQ